MLQKKSWVTLAVFLATLTQTSLLFAENYDEPVGVVSARLDLHQSPLVRQGGQGVHMTLHDCIQRALTHNNKIKSLDYGISAAEAQQKESHALGKPVFDYDYGTAPVPNDASRAAQTFFQGEWAWVHRVHMGMGIPVYTFGKMTTAQLLAGVGVDAAHEKRASESVVVVSRVRQMYYGIQLAEEIASLLLDAIDKLGNEVKKEDSGEPIEKASENYSPIDKLRMKVFRADLERRLSEARMREEIAIAALKVQMGLPQSVAIKPVGGLAPASAKLSHYDDYIAMQNERRPEAKLADMGVEAKRLEFRMSKKQWFPDLGVGAFFDISRTVGTVQNLQTTDDFVNPFDYTRAGVGLRLQGKFDVHGNKARSMRAENEYYKASLERDMAKQGLQLEVKEALAKVKQAKAQMQRTEETKKLARQMIFLSKSNLDLGIGEKAEYVDALQVMLLARSQYLESVFNYNAALAQLDEKIGYLPHAPDGGE